MYGVRSKLDSHRRFGKKKSLQKRIKLPFLLLTLGKTTFCSQTPKDL